jgi:cbb3-type cytochrome oxidase maturation protein
MSVILILIIASLTVALGFLAAFIWSVKSGQFEDDYTPSVRMLFDDTSTPDTKNTQSITSDKTSNKQK